MIFAIVWGSIVFIGENVFRNHGHHNNTTHHGQLNTVPADAGSDPRHQHVPTGT